MDFQKLFKDSWDQFLKAIIKLILFTLVGSLLCITIVLIPTVFAGLTRGFLGYIREGKEPDFNELWNFDGYVNVLLFGIIYMLAVGIGTMLLVVPGILFGTWWMYGLYYIVDRNMSFSEAMSASKDAVSRTGFWNNLGVIGVQIGLNSLGSTVFIGQLVTFPFGILIKANAYLQVSEGAPAATAVAPGAPPASPPPAS